MQLQTDKDTLHTVRHWLFHYKKLVNQTTVMNFTEHITQYYQTEARHGLVTSLITGIVLITSSFFLWRFSNPSTILRGTALITLIGGLIFSVGGFIDGYKSKKALPQKVQQYETNRINFLDTEVPKVEHIHKSWVRTRIFWSLVVATGLVILFTGNKTFRIGMGIGALIVGTIGHIEETISFQHNEKYRKEVLQEKLR